MSTNLVRDIGRQTVRGLWWRSFLGLRYGGASTLRPLKSHRVFPSDSRCGRPCRGQWRDGETGHGEPSSSEPQYWGFRSGGRWRRRFCVPRRVWVEGSSQGWRETEAMQTWKVYNRTLRRWRDRHARAGGRVRRGREFTATTQSGQWRERLLCWRT